MLPIKSFFILLFLTLVFTESHERRGKGHIRTGHYKDPTREGKLFSLFTIINFENFGCQSTSTSSGQSSQFRNGTCFTTSECSNKGGSAQGGCAAGFGVCCVFLITTGDTVTQNCSYIQNPSFPGTDSTATAPITYTINRCSNDICTLRLDFETFTLRGTVGIGAVDGGTEMTDGQCTDTFTVTTTTGQIIPVICGINTGYHMYVDIGTGSGNTATLTFTFSDSTTQRQWDIKVSQIECTNPSRPPDTCLQYLTGLTGRIETFNYNNNNMDNHLNAQNYAVCVRAEEGMCCVQYMVCPDQAGTVIPQPGFSLSPTPAGGGTAMVDDLCTSEDYVGIDQSAAVCLSATSTVNAPVYSRYCGPFLNTDITIAFNTPICDCTQPFSVDIFTNVKTDLAANAANTKLSRGLCLEYMQVAC